MGTVRWAALAALGFAVGMGTVVACGGSSSDDTIKSVDAGNTETGTGDDAADGLYTLDNICDRTGPLICEIRKPCCEAASGPGFDQAGCLAEARKTCEADVAAARAGQATFHPERIDRCIPKYREVFAQCSVSVEVLQKYILELTECQAFEGQLPEGSVCERGSQCKPATNPNEASGCDDDTKKCRITKFLGEGDACTLGDGIPGICAEGLYCNVSFASQPFTGVCKKKTSLGVACAKDQEPFNLECGLGNYCEKATAVCTIGKAGNVACANDLECASVSCTKPDAGADAGSTPGTCKPLKSLAKPEECKGS